MTLPETPLEVSARGAAALLGISRNRTYHLVARGVLPARPVGRTYIVRRSDVERLRRERPDLLSGRTPVGI